MKKIINAPENFSKETVEGILYAHADRLSSLHGDLQILVRNDKTQPGKVSVVEHTIMLNMLTGIDDRAGGTAH